MLRLLAVVALMVAPLQAATLVRLDTPVGSMTLQLYDDAKPVTVANFLNYLDSGRFQDSFAHRLVPGFVLQSGGFTLEGNTITSVPTDPPIINEFGIGPFYSNVKGTIAMAKLGGDPNSATSQWFLNLADNSANLDNQNGGFTVFGHVIEGLDVLDIFNTGFGNNAVGGPGVYNRSSQLGSSAFADLPLLANALQVQNLIFTDLTVIPEPGVTAMLMLGLGLILLAVRRHRHQSNSAR